MKYEKGSFIVVPNIHYLSGIPAITQAIYIWICSYADEKGQCFPSHSTLAKDSGTSKPTVERHINKLIKLGLLKKETRIRNKRQTSNKYQILIRDISMMREGHQSDEGGGYHKDEAELYPQVTKPTKHGELEIRIEKVSEKEPKENKDTEYLKVFSLWGKYPINWRANTTEKKAAQNILEEHGIEKAKMALNFFKENSHEVMCPKILKPSDLDRKWLNLQAYRDKNK